ncbi:MAG TPA: hypothetical protein VM925_18745, partial [Labilithrix sp.]|nr:hypothetical protein [Labilithrix sp.]
HGRGHGHRWGWGGPGWGYGGEPCGPTTCGVDEYCCNESCGICAPTGGACTQQVCRGPGYQY